MTVMNSKLGVNAFGATQTKPTSSNASQAQLTDADLKKLGGDNVGDILNKVADPNWVDPSKKMRTVGNDKLDKDAFFKLMLAQMKNQDPTNPLKSHEMAAQLASFSSLEQMQNMNTTLTEIKGGQKPTEQFQVLNLLGKAVAGDSSKILRNPGDKSHEFVFNLPMKAKEADIRVRNADGEVVKTYKLTGLKEGENRLPWNGQDEKGNATPAGEYQFFIEAKNDQGTKMAIKTEFEGQITGVNYAPEGPVLLIGNQAIRLRDVKKIVDPALLNAPGKSNEINPELQAMPSMPGLTMTPPTEANKDSKDSKAPVAAKAPEKKEVQGAPPAPQRSKILDQVGLSNEMMSKIAKETSM
ncbi:MAG: flagellar biosynthesis protein FlgD [Bdellovibrionaceae bacterium]|nr:flagellar biosynthesis protein FlgD [Pseudobdellovibrionaceae bacterium]